MILSRPVNSGPVVSPQILQGCCPLPYSNHWTKRNTRPTLTTGPEDHEKYDNSNRITDSPKVQKCVCARARVHLGSGSICMKTDNTTSSSSQDTDVWPKKIRVLQKNLQNSNRATANTPRTKPQSGRTDNDLPTIFFQAQRRRCSAVSTLQCHEPTNLLL